METDHQNMKSVLLDRVLRQLEMQIRKEDNTPVVLIGKSGIGKTESIRDLAEEMGIGFKEIRLSHYQESDLIGLPYIDEERRTCHASSRILPDPNSKISGILLLDEVTASPKSMRNAVYQLLDSSRSLGSYHLPEKWFVVACGNGPYDGGDYRGMEPAFMSRGFCWRVETNLDVWKAWAFRHEIHSVIIAFLNLNPSLLHVMDPERPFDMIACLRNWVKLSTQLKNLEESYEDGFISDREEVSFSAEGCVGSKCGDAFTTFYMNRGSLIKPEEILAGNVPVEELLALNDETLYITLEELAAHYAYCIKNAPEDPVGLTAGFFKWIIDLSEKVRLDAGLSLYYDLMTLCGKELKAIVMSEQFDRECPEFVDFAAENVLLL